MNYSLEKEVQRNVFEKEFVFLAVFDEQLKSDDD